MRCSVCGIEFGEGANCQNCGVDRVTGLGSYIGYDVPKINHSETSLTVKHPKLPEQIDVPEKEPIKVETMICYNCSEIIPDNSKFCPKCGRKLFTTCPKCGNIFSSEYPICNQCGTDIKKYLENLAKQRKRIKEKRKAEEERRRKEEEERKRKEEEERKRKIEQERIRREVEERRRKEEERRRKEEEEKKRKEEEEKSRKDIINFFTIIGLLAIAALITYLIS